jgi:D-alanyl-lipoteichoic acid acyltransferase DltB (MBOAT superfamily)
MGIQNLILAIITYFALASICLRQKTSKWRDVSFAVLNLVFILVPLASRWGERSPVIVSAVIYSLFVIGQYVVIKLLPARRAYWAALGPIALLVVFRRLPASLFGFENTKYLAECFVGLSYMVFRVSYASLATIGGFWEYLGFAFFAPGIVVGPITPYDTYAKSYRTSHPGVRGLLLPAMRIAIGASKYLFLASLLSRVTYSTIFVNDAVHPPLDLIVAAVAYYFFLYCNFSGFCDMAIGGAQLLGIELAENFDQPLVARNLKDFWNRWHITLSTYMRDVVFTPLSKQIIRWFGPRSMNHAVAFSVFTVFLLVGIWHGSGWNYFMFGFCHAVGVATHHYYTLALKRFLPISTYKAYQKSRVICYLAMALTFIYVTGSLFFFANTTGDMRRIFSLIQF